MYRYSEQDVEITRCQFVQKNSNHSFYYAMKCDFLLYMEDVSFTK